MLSVHLAAVQHAYVGTRKSITPVLANVGFDVHPGGFVAVVGPSGCGKSTLLRLISGLIEPSAGIIRVGESTSVSQLRSRKIGFVFQDPGLLPWRSTLGNIELPLEVACVPSPSTSARDALHRVGLEGSENLFPHQLSGGMRSRVALARALVLNPSLLLLDEPFGALDELTAEEMALEVLNCWTRQKFTAIMVTHSLSHAVLMADRVLVLSARPAHIVGHVDVKLARPRSLNDMDSAVYRTTVNSVRKMLEKHPVSTQSIKFGTESYAL